MEENVTPQGQTDPQIMELNFEVQALRNKLTKASQIIDKLSDDRALARIGFLFKILKYKEVFSEDVVAKTIEEISMVMFPNEEVVESEENE